MKKTAKLIERVETVLLKNNTGSGITAQRVSKLVKTPVENVYRLVYDLRKSGRAIYTNSKVMKGKKVKFYRAA